MKTEDQINIYGKAMIFPFAVLEGIPLIYFIYSIAYQQLSVSPRYEQAILIQFPSFSLESF